MKMMYGIDENGHYCLLLPHTHSIRALKGIMTKGTTTEIAITAQRESANTFRNIEGIYIKILSLSYTEKKKVIVRGTKKQDTIYNFRVQFVDVPELIGNMIVSAIYDDAEIHMDLNWNDKRTMFYLKKLDRITKEKTEKENSKP